MGKPGWQTLLMDFVFPFYSPTLGRFLQTDPVGYDDQVNLYAYVGDDPVNRADPSGNFQIAQAMRIGAMAGCAVTAEIGCVEGAVVGATGGLLVGLCIAYCPSFMAADEPAPPPPETNPYNRGRRGVAEPVTVVDPQGNAIPVGQGEHITGSPDGQYEQVQGANNRPTGVRIDRGGHRGLADPRARAPHAHRPGVTIDGNHHLPIRTERTQPSENQATLPGRRVPCHRGNYCH